MKNKCIAVVTDVMKVVACATVLAGYTPFVMAQGVTDFPTRPITLIVPFAPGASSDGVARVIAKELTASLGQQVIVDNRPGGGGATGLAALTRSAPDGYTIGLGATGALAVAPHLPDSPPLNIDKLQPLGKLADIPLVFVTSSKSGFASLKEVVEKGKLETIGVGNSGFHTSQHLAAELLAQGTKLKINSIPYKGTSPAVTDVLGGQIRLAVVDLTGSAGFIKAGSLKAIGITSEKRSRLAPDVPTVAESVLPGYSAAAWFGLFTPKGLPQATFDRLSKEFKAVMNKPEVQDQIIALSAEPAYLDPAQFGTYIAGQSKKWGELLGSMSKAHK